MNRHAPPLLALLCALGIVALAACGGEDGASAPQGADAGTPYASAPEAPSPGETEPSAEPDTPEPDAPDPDAPDPDASGASDMAAAVKAYYAAMERGDLAALFAVCTEEMAEGLENDLADRLGSYERETMSRLFAESAKAVAYEILEADLNLMDHDYGTVTVRRTYDDFEDKITFWMAKKDGTWLIQRADSRLRGEGMGAD